MGAASEPKKKVQRRSTKGKPTPRPKDTNVDKASGITTSPEVYQKVWKAYLEDTSLRSVQRKTGISRVTVTKLVQDGVPSLGLPPIREKFAEAMRLANQMDIDEAAKSIAMGRAAVRKQLGMLMVIQNRKIKALETDPDGISRKVNIRDHTSALKDTVLLNERLSAPTPEDDEAKALNSAAEVAEIFGGVLRSIAARRIPGFDAEKVGAGKRASAQQEDDD